MPGSTVSVFGEPDDYEAALRADGEVALLVTGRGEFRAHLTRIALDRMILLSGEETLSRIAFIGLGPRMVRVSLPARGGAALSLNGIARRPDEIVTHGPGHSLYERTEGPCRWRVIWLPSAELARYAGAMRGAVFNVPPGPCRWRPTPGALRLLTGLYDDAIRANNVRPQVTAGAKAARGLEQQVIEAVVECLRTDAADDGTPARRRHAQLRHAQIMSRFGDLLRLHPDPTLSVDDISATLDISGRTLRACCREHLGLSPQRYLRLHRMQLAHRELREAEPGAARVSDVARRFGFGALGRFAAAYREQFGELPLATLQSHPRS